MSNQKQTTKAGERTQETTYSPTSMSYFEIGVNAAKRGETRNPYLGYNKKATKEWDEGFHSVKSQADREKLPTGSSVGTRTYELTDGTDVFRTEQFNEYQLGVAQRTAERETAGNLFWREPAPKSTSTTKPKTD